MIRILKSKVMETQISYHEINKFLSQKATFKDIVNFLINKLNLPVLFVNVIFTNDNYLRELHKKYFNLDTKTDVITFNLNEAEEDMEAEIYISVERAVEQSKKFKINPINEICRLIVHGFLHLAGYDDLKLSDKRIMKLEEDKLVEEVYHDFYNKLYV